MNSILRLEIKTLAEAILEQTEELLQLEGDFPQIEIDILKDNLRKMYEALSVATKKQKITVAAPLQPIAQATRVQDSTDKMEELSLKIEEEITAEVSDFLNDENRGFGMVEKQINPNDEHIIEEVTIETPSNQAIRVQDSTDKMEELSLKIEEEITAEVSDFLIDENRGFGMVEKQINEIDAKPMAEIIIPEPSITNLFEPIVEETKIEKTPVPEKHVVDVLKGKPIESLRKAVGINDKFQFINELFEGNMAYYNKSIESLDLAGNRANAFAIIEQLQADLSWNEEESSYQQFLIYVSRRYQS